jgi:hypothetical protein
MTARPSKANAVELAYGCNLEDSARSTGVPFAQRVFIQGIATSGFK